MLFRDRRIYARYSVDAEAVWSAGRDEGRCPVHTLSWGGAEIDGGHAALVVGQRFYVTILASNRNLGTAEVEVVRTSGSRLGLRFLNLDDDLELGLEELFAFLTPLTK